MTQKESVIEALKRVGGKGNLKLITLVALNLKDVDWSKAEKPQANIRRIVRTNPDIITPLGNGEYELVSYRQELDRKAEEDKATKDELQRRRTSPYNLEAMLNKLRQEPPCYAEQKPILDFLEKIAVSSEDKEMIQQYKNWLYKSDTSRGFRFEQGSNNTIYTN